MEAAAVVVSPHLDDAVLSCAGFLASRPGTVVVTVFAGRPADGRRSAWDRASFRPGQDPMVERWAEDRSALHVLGATPVHLEHLDVAYGLAADADVTAGVAAVLEELRPSTVLLPVGLGHPNHVQVHRAVFTLRSASQPADWYLYAELPYAVEMAGLLQHRLDDIRKGGHDLREADLRTEGHAAVKRTAIDCYASQVRTLGRARVRRSLTPERYWAVRPPVPDGGSR